MEVMILTNQTKSQITAELPVEGVDIDDFINYLIEDSYKMIQELTKMEKNIDIFPRFGEIINVDCETLFDELNDECLTYVFDSNKDVDFEGILKLLCEEKDTLYQFKDESMETQVMFFRILKISSLLNRETNLTYDYYNDILSKDYFYKLFTEITLIIRPIRSFIIKYLNENIIQKILNEYISIIIIYLVINFVFQISYLIYIKFYIINNAIQNIKDITGLGFALSALS